MLRIKRKGNSESIREKDLQAQIEKTNSDRKALLASRSALLYWLLQSDQKPFEPKKGFVKNPLFPSAFGQNKTLKLCQNNVVINTGENGPQEPLLRSFHGHSPKVPYRQRSRSSQTQTD
jgi:hypothetical protein